MVLGVMRKCVGILLILFCLIFNARGLEDSSDSSKIKTVDKKYSIDNVASIPSTEDLINEDLKNDVLHKKEINPDKNTPPSSTVEAPPLINSIPSIDKHDNLIEKDLEKPPQSAADDSEDIKNTPSILEHSNKDQISNKSPEIAVEQNKNLGSQSDLPKVAPPAEQVIEARKKLGLKIPEGKSEPKTNTVEENNNDYQLKIDSDIIDQESNKVNVDPYELSADNKISEPAVEYEEVIPFSTQQESPPVDPTARPSTESHTFTTEQPPLEFEELDPPPSLDVGKITILQNESLNQSHESGLLNSLVSSSENQSYSSNLPYFFNLTKSQKTFPDSYGGAPVVTIYSPQRHTGTAQADTTKSSTESNEARLDKSEIKSKKQTDKEEKINDKIDEVLKEVSKLKGNKKDEINATPTVKVQTVVKDVPEEESTVPQTTVFLANNVKDKIVTQEEKVSDVDQNNEPSSDFILIEKDPSAGNKNGMLQEGGENNTTESLENTDGKQGEEIGSETVSEPESSAGKITPAPSPSLQQTNSVEVPTTPMTPSDDLPDVIPVLEPPTAAYQEDSKSSPSDVAAPDNSNYATTLSPIDTLVSTTEADVNKQLSATVADVSLNITPTTQAPDISEDNLKRNESQINTTEEVLVGNKTSEETEGKQNPDAEGKNTTKDDIETYSQFAERVAMEKKNDADHTNGAGSSKTVGRPQSESSKKVTKPLPTKKDLSKNYARWECGSKLLASNPEAVNALYVLSSEDDEYLLSNCLDQVWLVIELCDSIRPIRFELGNTELYSNLPKDIAFYGSQRYPTKEWTELGKFAAKEERAIQQFYIDTKDVFKYIRLEVLSHYGTEFFCPLTQLKVYGVSELEVVDSMEDEGEEEDVGGGEAEVVEEGKKKEVKKEKQGMLPLVLRSMLTNVLGVLNRGASQSLSGQSSTSPPAVDECTSLEPHFKIDEKKCSLAPTINWHLGCYAEEYKYVLSLPIVRKTVQDRQFCKRLVDNLCREKIDKEMREDGIVGSEYSKHFPAANQVDLNFACSKKACGDNYVCIMMCSHHLLALCHISHYTSPMRNVSSEQNASCSATTGSPVLHDNVTTNSNIVDNKWNNGVQVNAGAEVAKEIEGIGDGGAKDKQSIDQKTASSVKHVDGVEKIKTSGSMDIGDITQKLKDKVKGDAKEHEVKGTKDKKGGKKVEGDGNGAGGKKDELPSNGSPLPTVDQAPPSKETNGQGGPKESVVVRLTNKVKALEHNLSISSQYLEELSLRYKRQMEDMQRQFSTALDALNNNSNNNSNSSHGAPPTGGDNTERLDKTNEKIEVLQEQIQKLAEAVSVIASEQQNLATKVVEQHLLLMLVEVLLLMATFYFCMRRHRRHPLPTSPTHSQSHGNDNSLYSSSDPLALRWHPANSRRNSTQNEGDYDGSGRRRSNEDLYLSGTYDDLLIQDNHGPSKKANKKKKNNGMKRSNSSTGATMYNGYDENNQIKEEIENIDGEFTVNNAHNQRNVNKMQHLSKSSAGVLFMGKGGPVLKNINGLDSSQKNVHNFEEFRNKRIEDRLMRISECSESSSLLNNSKELNELESIKAHEPNGGVDNKVENRKHTNKEKSRSRDNSKQRNNKNKHRRGASDGSITYSNDGKKKNNGQQQNGCVFGGKKVKKQNGHFGGKHNGYGSLGGNGSKTSSGGCGWSNNERSDM